MADVSAPHIPSEGRSSASEPGENGAEPFYDIMGLLFFAYRDFVRDADALLADYGFGRAHHRVLHFVERHPGLRVTELLDILKITKQSLGRVLRELLDTGFVTQEEGRSDRRQRLLYTTPKGSALAAKLAALQDARISAAMLECGQGGHEAARAFLFAMVDPQDRSKVRALMDPYLRPASART
jgi:DNA-binding MarR family transcriptional regulator